MSGQSPHVELQRQFHYEPAAAASGFVQQHGKLFSSVFEDILRRFTLQTRPKRQWNGYTLPAVNGSHVQIPSDIHDKMTYFTQRMDMATTYCIWTRCMIWRVNCIWKPSYKTDGKRINTFSISRLIADVLPLSILTSVLEIVSCCTPRCKHKLMEGVKLRLDTGTRKRYNI